MEVISLGQRPDNSRPDNSRPDRPGSGGYRLVMPSLRWPLGLLAAAVVIFGYYYLDTYFRSTIPTSMHAFTAEWLPLLSINEALVYVMCALGLNIVVGYAGLLDLGFVAFWAIGGYTAGWLMSGFINSANIRFFGSEFSKVRNIGGIHISFWVVLVAAGLLCALFGVLIGAPTLRLRSDYLALVTLGFGEIIPEVFYNGDDVFGANISNGTQGITPVDSVRFFGFTSGGGLTFKDLGPFDVLPKFVILCGLAALIMFASLRIRDGKLGRAWLAIREDELAASAMGVPLMRTKLSAYAIGAVAGGMAGVAFAIHVSAVLPDRFRFDISITLLAMVVLGGMGNVWGVTVGALSLAWFNSTGLPKIEEELSQNFGVDVSISFLFFGAVLVLMMLFRREGLIPEARTRLVLREPERTQVEALGADLEPVAPELGPPPGPADPDGSREPTVSDLTVTQLGPDPTREPNQPDTGPDEGRSP